MFGSNGPRKFQIIIPTVTDNEYEVVKPVSVSGDLVGLYQSGSKRVATMINNPPHWSESFLISAQGLYLGLL